MTTSELVSQSDLDPTAAREIVGGLSVGLGALAVLAPSATARVFGTAAAGPGTLFVRMVGARNLTMGLRTLQATGDERRAAVQAGLVVGAVDTAAVLVAASRGYMTKKAAARALLVLGAFAALGYVAGLED